MVENCEFCNNSFSDKVTLKRHQKTAKYCVKLQDAGSVSQNKKHLCDFCDKEYTQKTDLNRHMCICVEKRIKE